MGSHFYTAYDVKSAPPHPFDLEARKAAEAGSAPIKGYLWASDLRCTIAGVETERRVELNFEAGALSFHENGTPWTKPFRAKLLFIVVARGEKGWVASEQRGDYSVLMPELRLRKPMLEEIPPSNVQLRIPCKADQLWKGRRCVSAARVLRPGR